MSSAETLDPSIAEVVTNYEEMFDGSRKNLAGLGKSAFGMALFVGGRHLSYTPHGEECATHVCALLVPGREDDPRTGFQEFAIANCRILDSSSTVARMIPADNGKLRSSKMNQDHIVAGHLIEADTHRIAVQVAFDSTSGRAPNEREVQQFFKKRSKRMGELAAELAEAMGVGSRYERLFSIDHAPVVPNASVVSYDITGSTSMTSRVSGYMTEWMSNFAMSHAGEFMRLQQSGDGAIFARYMTPMERNVPVGHSRLPEDAAAFAQEVLNDFRSNCKIDQTIHPIRIVAANTFLDVVAGEETGNLLWGGHHILKKMPRDRSRIEAIDGMVDREGNTVHLAA